MVPRDAPTNRANPQAAAPFAGVVEELPAIPDVEAAFLHFAALPHGVFFDSARPDMNLARYSFLAADPFDYVTLSVREAERCRGDETKDPFRALKTRMDSMYTESIPGLPPFQGGLAGLWSYDLNRAIERISAPGYEEFDTPALAVGMYDVVLAIDHVENRAWWISQGWPEREPNERTRRAQERLQKFKDVLNDAPEGRPAVSDLARSGDRPQQSVQGSGFRVQDDELAPQFPTLPDLTLTSSFSRGDYLATVERAIEYIRAGDIFQVNLAQRLLHPAVDDSRELYLRLRRRNPATFAAYFDMGAYQIVSASPERFLQVHNRQVEARPIKGTRRRSPWPEADLFAGDDLLQSQKDRAENVMIVDLLRNDLSRVCRADSVRVTELCRLELYEYVQHLVSVVQGTLADGQGPLDLLRAAFPGGSITGAPKVRAMEIIAELEPTARGPYCGSLAYLGFDGTFDSSILIRTITAGRGWWQLPVGGGIVAQSEPVREYEETWHKAEGLLRALR